MLDLGMRTHSGEIPRVDVRALPAEGDYMAVETNLGRMMLLVRTVTVSGDDGPAIFALQTDAPEEETDPAFGRVIDDLADPLAGLENSEGDEL